MSRALVVSNPSRSAGHLRFSTGSVDPGTGSAAFFPDSTRIPGAINPDWALVQWGRGGAANEPEYLNPANATIAPASVYDAQFGLALYSIASNDGTGQFSVFRSASGALIYDIRESISPATAPSSPAYLSPDLFLSTVPFPADRAPVTLDHPLTISLDERIKTAQVSYLDPTLPRFPLTTPMATGLIGIVALYASSTFRDVVFLQADLTDSRYGATPFPYQSTSSDGFTNTVIYCDQAASQAALPYASSAAWQHVEWNVNAMLEDSIRDVAVLSGAEPGIHDLARWTLGSVYIGPELGGINLPHLNGSATLEMQLANIQVAWDPAATYRADTAPAGGAPLIANIPTDVSSTTAALTEPTGQATSSILWTNAGTGEVVAWQLANGVPASATSLLDDASWSLVGSGDFNGDGNQDLLWRNAATGVVVQWLMNGTGIATCTQLLQDASWTVAGTGDFNGDGKADILWRQAATGSVVEWQMNGSHTIGGGEILRDPGWNVAGTGDLNGDGQSDILWCNAGTGQTVEWLMNGIAPITTASLLIDPNWNVAATGDLNGDGKADILWRNPGTGAVVDWHMDSTGIFAAQGLLNDPAWSIAGSGDYNHDGKADILWHNAGTGETVAWMMNGSTPIGASSLFTSTAWSPAHAMLLTG